MALHDSSPLVLERPGSPIPSGTERATKKVKNKEVELDPHRDSSMEKLNHNRNSFKEALLSNVRNKYGSVNEEDEQDNLEISEADVRVTLDGPYPKVFFSDEVQ